MIINIIKFIFVTHSLALTYPTTELATVYKNTTTKNQKSSKYPAGPNNSYGNRSNGLMKYSSIVPDIFSKFVVLKKYLMNPSVSNLSEAALKTYGN